MKELQEKKQDEIVKLLSEKRKALADFRSGMSKGKLKNVKEGRGVKKDIARILTEVKRRASLKTL